MTNIERFDEVTGLVGYWSTAESVIDETGGIVDGITSVYGSGVPGDGSQIELRRTQADNLTLTATAVGAMDGIVSLDNDNCRLGYTFSPVLDFTSTGLTWAIAMKVLSANGDRRHYIGHSIEGNTLGGWIDQRTDTTDRVQAHRTSGTYTGATDTTNVQRWIVSNNGDQGNQAKVMRNGVLEVTGGAASSGITNVHTFGAHGKAYANEDSPHMASAIILLYARQLTDQEMADVDELMNYWVVNNEGPSTAPTSGTFGTVTTTDDASITSWQWQESSDGIAWADVGTILTDTEGADTQTLTVKSATLAMDQTQVKCLATYGAGTVIESNTATLTVV